VNSDSAAIKIVLEVRTTLKLKLKYDRGGAISIVNEELGFNLGARAIKVSEP
jgi:hypothetical protein